MTEIASPLASQKLGWLWRTKVAHPEHDWASAKPARIQSLVEASQRRTHGGWFALGPINGIAKCPTRYVVDNQDIIVWRDNGRVLAAPDACPHMGASLEKAEVCQGKLVCPWHGLRLGPEGHGRWRHYETYDDGVLLWVCLSDVGKNEVPIVPERPRRYIAGVYLRELACEARDVISNRLDVWHGHHLHPAVFAHVDVTSVSEQAIEACVIKRILGPLCVRVDVRFSAPTPNMFVMEILRGESAGTVLETHVRPLQPGRCLVIETVWAASERKGFAWLRYIAPLVRWGIRREAKRLWDDDAPYAERLYALRNAGPAGA